MELPLGWMVATLKDEEKEQSSLLQSQLGLTPLIAQILIRRGISTPEETNRFLHGTLEHFPNPFGLPEMDLAVERLLRAYQNKEKILLFGDYDVDGISGTAQLASFFKELNHPVQTVLPHRLEEGYGLSKKILPRILSHRPQLVVTIDNGTHSYEEIRFLKDKQIDVIIIDHHETPREDSKPPAVALINPKSPSSRFPEKELASAGLVFLLLMALRSKLRQENPENKLPNLKRYLDLACLGTIADVVPLKGTNRLIVKYGLKEIETTTRPGLKALQRIASINTPLSASSVAFRLIPRLNAAGRLASPEEALSLLMETNEATALTLANHLDDLNKQRQKIEEQVTLEAIHQVEQKQKDRKGLVVASSSWHLGVVGIVAARLVEAYQRPAIVLSLNAEEGTAKGSARTIAGLSVYKALSTLKDHMIHFGGHDAAAGMTLKIEALEEFSIRFHKILEKMSAEQPSPVSVIDAVLPLEKIDHALMKDLHFLEPFGAGNPEPVFLTPSVGMSSPRTVGGKYLKTVVSQNNTHLEAIAFQPQILDQISKKMALSTKHHVVHLPQLHSWNGIESIQLKLKALF